MASTPVLPGKPTDRGDWQAKHGMGLQRVRLLATKQQQIVPYCCIFCI